MKSAVKKKRKSRFELGGLQTLAITLVIITIVVAVGLQILADQKSDMTSGTLEYNATAQGLEAVAKIPDKLPMIVGVVLGIVVISIVIGYFATKRR